jgi:3-deoxy-D-manno-octulosonic-acid transferase
VIFGPHMFNAQESADSLLAAGGAKQVDSTDALAAVICEWLGEPQERAMTGKLAEQVVDARRGAVRKAIELIESILA